MKTIVMGKKVTNNYDVVVKRDEDNKFIERPYISRDIPDIKWEKICEYDGEPQFSFNNWSGRGINISENEAVRVTEQIFRADLGNHIQYTNKVLDVDENNKPECEYELTKLLKEYNKQMIENDERAKAYCDLHKLDYEESDYDEIIKIIGENKPKMEIPMEIPKVWNFDSSFLTNKVLKIDDIVPDYVTLNI